VNPRNALLVVALAFGTWETVDIVDTGVPAAVFAVLFLASALWLWRRNTRIAAALIAALCSVEASQAHTWKDAGPAAKDAAMALGSAGILAALTYLVRRRHTVNA
jgi:uncharacterized membrane protein